MVGPCTIFGAYVADNQTIEYYLQELINKDGLLFQVVNFGALGLFYEFQYLLTECICDKDIVILASSKELLSIMNQYSNTYYLGDYSDIFDSVNNPLSYILDTFRHVNYEISKIIANRIYIALKQYLLPQTVQTERRIKGSYSGLFYFLGYRYILQRIHFGSQFK